MELIATKCQQCSATLSVAAEQKFARCDHCGSQYVIEWGSSFHPGLTKFETILSKIVDTTTFLAADRRLSYLENDIQRTRNELSAKQGSLETSQAAGRTAIQAIKKQVSDTDMAIGIAVGVALLAFILLFSSDKFVFLAIALLSICFIAGAYLVRRSLAAGIPSRQMETDAVLNLEKEAIREVQLRLDDLLLEKELCERTAGKYRFSEK